MCKHKANDIYEKIKTPAKLRNSPINKDILRGDELKGYERILRKITDELGLPWSEYWSFLDTYCNFQSREGLEKLESYFRQKKLQLLLDTQIRSTQIMLEEKASCSPPNQSEHLLSKLNLFLRLVDQLRVNLEFVGHENQLSGKYEGFVKFMLENQTKNLNSLLSNNTKEMHENRPAEKVLAAEDAHQSEKEINDTLTRYMSVVIELSRIDKSSRCYFNLYKTSKLVLDLLNCQKIFDSFYLSPVFKQRVISISANAAGEQQNWVIDFLDSITYKL